MLWSLLLLILWLALGLLLGAVYISALSATARPIQAFAVGLVITAFAYVVFAWLGDASSSWILGELVGVFLYGMFAWRGVSQNKSWLALGWLLHPIWDVALHCFGSGAAHAPTWWAVACVSFDVMVAAYLYNADE